VQVLGRKDFQVKLRGFRIELGEIESACLAYPGVTNAVALVKERRLVAYVAPSTTCIADLERSVASSLPYYMIPDLFIMLDVVPLTSIGKADRKALAAQPLPSSSETCDSADDRPVSEIFSVLRRSLAETLNIDPAQVVPSATFLQLGGDSISAILFSSRCRKYGLTLTVAEILKQPLLSRLEQNATWIQGEAQVSPLMDPTGQVPLTAVAHRVLPTLRHVSHFNQSFLLRCRIPLTLSMLKEAVSALVTHHDMLRVSLTRHGDRWVQSVRPLPLDLSTEAALAAFALVTEETVTLSNYDAWVLRTQESICVDHGPIMVSCLLNVDDQTYVYLTIHHLAIDYVAWRILLEDLEALLRGQTLPPKTLSFRQWSTLVNEYAQTLPDDVWPGDVPLTSIPLELEPIPSEPVTVRTVKSIHCTLGLTLSELLYRQATTQTDASPLEFMVASLAMALTSTFNIEAVELEMEGHGRRPWRSDIDVSRTVGWFTSIYPVTVHVAQARCYPQSSAALRILSHVKQRLRSVPDNGFPYGLVKYLKKPESTSANRTAEPSLPPGIVFNYAGRFEQLESADAFWEPTELTGAQNHDLSLDEVVQHALTASCSFEAPQGLVLTLGFSTLLHKEDTILRLTSLWRDNLAMLIQDAMACPALCRVPVDFDLSALSEPEFGTVVAEHLPRLDLTLADLDDMYPTLPIQDGLLLATLKDPAAYMVQFTFNIRGELDIGRLRQAWEDTTRHHPTLRTRFLLGVVGSDHDNLQLVTVRSGTVWTEGDWSDADLDNAETSFLRREREAGFHPEQPLVRLGLFRLNQTTHRLVMSIHHAILDGWSHGLLTRTLLAAYAGLDLPPTGLIKGLVQYVVDQVASDAQQFWTDQFAGAAEPSLLVDPHHTPDNLLRPSDTCYYGEVTHSLEMAGPMMLYAQSQGITLSTLLRAALTITLHRYTGSPDPIFGTVVSGRNIPVPQVESIVGPCINTLPCRVPLDQGLQLGDLFRSIHTRGTSAYSYEHCRLTDIHTWSGVSLEQPLFNLVFALENYPETESCTDLPVQFELVSGRDPADVPFTIAAFHNAKTLAFRATYQTRSFSADFAQRFMGHFVNTLQYITTVDPDTPVELVDIFSPEDHRQLIETWARNPHDYLDRCAYSQFVEQAIHFPEYPAIEDGRTRLTYGDLNRASDRLAAILTATCPCRPGTIVGLVADRSAELVVGQLAIWKTGSAFVVICPDYPIERRQFILKDADCQAVLMGGSDMTDNGEGKDTFPTININMDALLVPEAVAERSGYTPDPHDLAYVVYTSGSTGIPKGVMVEHAALANFLYGYGRSEYIMTGAVVPTLFSPAFDGSLKDIWLVLSFGGTLLVCRDDIPGAIRQSTHITCMPSLLAQLEPQDYPNLVSVMVGGEPVPQALADKWVSHVHFRNVYGPTEATLMITYATVQPGAAPSIGRPIPNAVCLILDDHLRPVPVGVPGILYLGGRGLARGYLNRPDLTAEKFITWPVTGERLYHTGDLARWLPDGQIECLGRRDNQVKVRGFRIELGEVEETLVAHPAVTQACVIVQDAHLVGYVTPQTVPIEQVLGAVRAKLPYYMVPTGLVALDNFPLTRVGKVDRKALPAFEFTRSYIQQGEMSPVERQLVECVAETLRLEPSTISPDTTYYQLGGNSLSAIQLVSRYKRQGFDLQISDITRDRTLRSLALQARPLSAAQGPGASSDILIPKSNVARLTPAQKQFFALSLANPHLFITPVVYKMSHRFSPERWRTALAQMALRHPMLRARFHTCPPNGDMTYTIDSQASERHYRFAHHRLPNVDAMRAVLPLVASRLHIQDGPLAEFHVFDLGVEQYFFHCVHHLVTDYVSVSVFTTDLAQLLTGQPLEPTTTPYQDWADYLYHAAQRMDLTQIDIPVSLPKLPTPVVPSPGYLDTGSTINVCAVVLDQTSTHKLLTVATGRWRATPLELLVTALHVAFKVEFRLDTLGLAFVTHGRQPFDGGDVDVSRTLGFFAHQVPVVVTSPGPAKLTVTLNNVRPALATGVDNGQRLMLVKNLREFADPAQRLPFDISPQVSFTYLADTGLSTASVADSPTFQVDQLFQTMPEMVEALSEVRAGIGSMYPVNVGARSLDGQLHLTVDCDLTRVPPTTAARVLDNWHRGLLEVISQI
ncbi:hypothetical protein IWQ60_009865, partial [Tieghemiomyces parasiticus]